MDAAALHAQSIVIDSTCPLLNDASPEYIELYRQGGVTALGAGALASASNTLRNFGRWHRLARERDDLLIVHRAQHIRDAKAQGRLGIFLHCQGTEPIEDNPDLIDAFKAIGMGVMGLAYNTRNAVCDGAEEPEDAGLSRYGRRVVRRLNEARVIVDCSHVGRRSSLEAIALSTAPAIFSHSNPRAVFDSRRNIADDQIRACAETGGVVGIMGFPAFIGAGDAPTLDDWLRHVEHVIAVAGIDHVGIGMDYFRWQEPYMPLAAAQAMRDDYVARGLWDGTAYRNPPYHYPAGIETPDRLGNLTAELLRRQYSPGDIAKVLGGNWLRVYEAVWG